MTTRTWIGGRRPFVAAPRPRGPRPHLRRLRVEALEDRTVPSDSHLTLELKPAAGQSSPAPVTIVVDGFTFGFHDATTIGSATGGAGAGKAKFDELAVRAPMSPDSPVLLNALVTGAHYGTAVLTQRDAAGNPVAAWVLGTVFVTGDVIDNDSAARPAEKLTFAFGSVTEATSVRTTSWDQVDNSAGEPGLPDGLSLSPLPGSPARSALTLELTPGAGSSQSPVTFALKDFSFGFENPTTIGSATGGAGAGKARFDELEVTAPFGADSPLLLHALVTGSHYDTAVLVQRDDSGQAVAAWALGTVFLTDDAVTGGDGFPAERLKFAFGSLTEATSARTTSWSQITNSESEPGLPAGLSLSPLPAGPAAPSITLDLTPVPGSPQPPVSVAVNGFTFGFENVTTIGSATGGAGAGKARFDDLEVTAAFAADSPALLRALVVGSHYKTAVLTQRDARGQPVAAWALETVVVTGDAVTGGDGFPAETLKFVFGSVAEATSSNTTSWNQAENSAGETTLPDGLSLSPLPAGPAAPAITLDLSPDGGSPAVSVAVNEFSFGLENPTTIGSATTGAGAGKAKFDELEVKAAFAADSPLLLHALVTGAHYNTAVLTQRDASGKPVAAWVLGTVFLTDDAVSGGDELPTETLKFAFGSLTEATSAETTSWDAITNTRGEPDLPDGLVLGPLPAGPAAPTITLDLSPTLVTDSPISVPVSDFTFGFQNVTTIGSATGGAGAGKAKFDALEVKTTFGANSPLFLQILAAGVHFETAVLTQRDAKGQPVAAWALGTVLLTDDAVSGGDGLPAESLKFLFVSVTEATSSNTTSWNQAENSAGEPDLPDGLVLGPLPPAPAAPAITLDLSAAGATIPAISLPLNGYTLGFHNTTTIGSATGGAGAGKASFDELEIKAPFGADSPLLLRALVNGLHYNTAVLVQRNTAGRPVAAWALGTVFLTDDAIAGGDGLPAETLKFAFGSVKEATRSATTSWSAITNSANGPALPAGLVLVPLDDVAPTDITLSNAAVAENLPAGTAVGTFGTTDPDAGDVFTYTLVNGPGDTGNGSFALDAAGHLTTAASFDFEAQSGYSIRVRSTDVAGLWFEKVFTIGVLNVNEAPTVTGFTKVGAEDNALAFAAADFTGHYADPDGDPLAAVRVVSLPTGGVLKLNGTAVRAGQVIAAADLNRLAFAPALNFSGVVSFRYTASDGALFAAAPATVTLDIRSVQQQAAAVNQIIQGLVNDGTLNGGQGKALTISLKGNSGDAGKVQAFLNQLAAFLKAGILSPEQYAGLYQGGRALLASVSAH